MSELRLIFLISLPRSGSTLLQKMLTVNPEVHSIAEPWLLLPFAYMIQKEGTRSIYSHRTCFYAIEDFIDNLPNKADDFNAALEAFTISLYSKTISDKKVKYFIDKTPRYYLILPFLAEVFTNAKFIFLFRNPLSVLSSILTTWMNNKMITSRHYVDLYKGPHLLSEGFNLLKDRSIAVNYADMVVSPEAELQKICSFLEINYSKDMAVRFSNVDLIGRMGDQVGINKTETVSVSSLGKWKTVLNTRYRKWLAKRYIKQIGDNTLTYFGTSIHEMTSEINSITDLNSGSAQDIIYHLLSNFKRFAGVQNIKESVHSFFSNDRNYPYT